jgi:hypothetical protein
MLLRNTGSGRATSGVSLGLGLLLCGCYNWPWPVHSAIAAKPALPITAPAGSALLVVMQTSPNGEGAGSTTVFEKDVPIAQFDELTAGWTTVVVKPGKHSYYVYPFDGLCARIDGDFAPSKIYAMALDGVSIPRFVGPGELMHPSGPMSQLPFVVLDGGAARAEVARHESQRSRCMTSADSLFAVRGSPSSGEGFESISW